MKIKYCSLTGSENEIDDKELAALSERYPFAEWAILLLPARAGTLRFPTLDWIADFQTIKGKSHTAMHLCDDGFLGFVHNNKTVLNLMHGYDRIQLNLKFGDVEGKYDPAELVARVRENPQHQFILQYTHDKQGLLPLFRDVPNHAVLFDESAGRGISPDSWDAPLNGHFCGYAGGMNPDNVKANLEMIKQVADGHLTWIDMETGIRTDDHFDMSKAERVLSIAKDYI